MYIYGHVYTENVVSQILEIFETTLSGGAWKKSIENGVVLVRIEAKSWSPQVLYLASSENLLQSQQLTGRLHFRLLAKNSARLNIYRLDSKRGPSGHCRRDLARELVGMKKYADEKEI